ncbi:hypothetical protein BH20BAC1_BH20BAC1_01670 [soil metagenome]
MKKIILLAIVFVGCLQFNIFSANAQTLYGTTVRGGDFGGGTINKFLPATSDLAVVKSFEREKIASIKPEGNLIQATDGKFYGIASLFFPTFYEEAGIIFSFDPVSSTYTVQHYFDGYSSGTPIGSLMQASDGKLYGLTAVGGIAGNAGYMFSFDPATSNYLKLHEFHDDNIGSPVGSLMQASNGKLYGMTTHGIFSFDPAAATFTKLKDLDYYKDGYFPSGNLVQASDGKLYGVTSQGGSSGRGVIFSYDPAVSVYTKLKDFDYNLGGNPSGTLVQAGDGKLYGTAGGGSNYLGLIYSFDPSTSTYKELIDFNDSNGAYPSGGLLQANDGKIYGTTTSGGANGNGVIFSFDVFTSMYTKLKDFDSADRPSGRLVQASDGKLYGMTSEGGSNGFGVIFSLDPATLNYAVLKAFEKYSNINNGESGSYPSGSVVQGSDGKLYGLTYAGGSKQYGVIYSLDPSTSTYTKLKDFNNTDGAYPVGPLLQASDGKLYGMTSSGGSASAGVIFSFEQSTSTYTRLIDFDINNGRSPRGSLVQANDGKLYGMTSHGGSTNFGVIFSFDPLTFTYSKLYDFNGFSEGGSSDGMVQASDGKLYGMVAGGENETGLLFSFDPSSSSYTRLKTFNSMDGFAPAGRLVSASNGLLYGTTMEGGSSDAGVIFSFDPVSSTYTRLKDFDGTNGAFPYGSLMQASDGKLYGMTNRGGRSSLGVIFSFDPSSATYTKLKDFDGANGALPSWGSFIEIREPNKPVVSSFTLVNADTDDDIQSIPDGSTLDINTLPRYVNIRANTNPNKVGSVVFILDGKKVRTENGAPYALAGDNPAGDYHNWTLPLGDHTLTAIPYSNYNGKGTEGTALTIHFTVVGQRVESFTLINAKTDKGIQSINDGAIIDLNKLPTHQLNIRANTNPGKVGSVVFVLDGKKVRTENGAPYALAGDFPSGDYHAWALPLGNHTLTAIPYSNYNAKGTEGVSLTIHFTIVNNQANLITMANRLDIPTEVINFSLYPNPVNKILNINIGDIQPNGKSTVAIINSSGAVVRTIQVNGRNNIMQLHVSSLAPGIYFIKIINGDKVMNRRFVKL